MTKLTLSVDEKIVERAKRYAARQGTSVSRLVQTYLDLVSRASIAQESSLPPVTRRLRGALKGAKHSRDEYVDHLERKYR
jgi:hypothetical protein